MKRIFHTLITASLILPLLAGNILTGDEELFERFYNYRFDATVDYLEEKAQEAAYPYPYCAFLSYALIRAKLANAEYADLHAVADSLKARYRPGFETYLAEHPEDADAQFYYMILLAVEMRIYLHEMNYLSIMKRGPQILSRKLTVDKYSEGPYADLDFGTGSFDYYLSVIGRNAGLGKRLTRKSRSNGIDDLWNAYREADFTSWESAIALMYIYLYDKNDHAQCRELTDTFLRNFPDNLEVLAIAAENDYHMHRWFEGNRYLRRIERLLDEGILYNDAGWRSRITYLKGVRAMLRDQHVDALKYFNDVYEKSNIEYSWYTAIVLKYSADVYLEMGLRKTAEIFYEKAVESGEMIPHVRDARNILKKLRRDTR